MKEKNIHFRIIIEMKDCHLTFKSYLKYHFSEELTEMNVPF